MTVIICVGDGVARIAQLHLQSSIIVNRQRRKRVKKQRQTGE
jgi:hypothetical protein